MAGKKQKNVSEFALYYRKYRELKKQGITFKRGRPKANSDESNAMRIYRHDKAMEILAEQEKEN